MKDLFEICGECRHLSDAEVVYQLTNNKETSNQVNAMLANGSNVSIEDICNLLTPARREMALAVIELYKRIKERKNNYKRITSSADVYEVMLPYMADLKVEECWVIFLNQASRIIRKQRISVGGLASTQVDVRVILHEALSCSATSMILCHNHPSGNFQPSKDDDRLTHALLEAGRIMNIRLLDQQMFEGTFFNLLKAQENIRNSIHAYFFWINIDNYSRIEEKKEEKHGVNFFAYAKSELTRLNYLISHYDSQYCTLDSLQEELNHFNISHEFDEDTYFYDMQELEELKLKTKLQYLSICYRIDYDYFNQKRRKEDTTKKVTYIYWLLYSRYEFCLSHYCRHFYNLVKFLDDYNNKLLSGIGENEQEKKLEIVHKISNYLSFIQSCTSSSELVILYYNMLLFPKARALYAKYNVFENLNKESLLHESHATFFPDIRLKSEDDLKSRFLTEDEMINE